MDPSERASAFDRVAESYDAVRPGYPRHLIERVMADTGAPSGAGVLEIGCGTGQATRVLAELGFRVLALEPGPSLASVAARRLATFAGAEVRAEAFGAGVRHGAFDVVFAATSFHWLDPDSRVDACADHLVPTGCLAVIANTHPRPFQGFFERVQEIYEEVVPEWSRRPGSDSMDDVMQRALAQVAGSPRFRLVSSGTHDWTHEFDTPTYLRLLGTFSDHLRLEPTRREALFDRIAAIIDAEYGGVVHRPYRTLTLVARRIR